MMHHAHGEMLPARLQRFGAVTLTLMLGVYYVKVKILDRFARKESARGKIVLKVEGMTCQHCAANVKKAVASIDGARGIIVDLNGKKVEFIFFVDDHAYEEMGGLHPRERSKRRNTLYSLRSGQDASLPDEYKKIFSKYGFSEADVLRHDHGKDGRSDCLYFSEKILRASTKKIDNACAREYTEFIEDPKYFDKKQSYLVAFIPNRCRGHICDVALAHEVKDIHASHIFMETLMLTASRKELFEKGRGVTYRKD